MKIVDKLAKEYSDILIEKNKFDDSITMYAYEDFKAGYQAAILEILKYDQDVSRGTLYNIFNSQPNEMG